MPNQKGQQNRTGDEAETRAEHEGSQRINDLHVGNFIVDHWLGVLLITIVGLLMSPLFTFPGGNPRQLWWVWAGACIVVNVGLWWVFHGLIARMSESELARFPTTQPSLTASASAALSVIFDSQTTTQDAVNTAFWCHADDGSGPGIFPIGYLVYLGFTNDGDAPLRVRGISIETQTVDGNWVLLPTYPNNFLERIFVITDDPTNASEWQLSSLFLKNMEAPIPPRSTIVGWVAFSATTLEHANTLRMPLRDGANRESVLPIEVPLDVSIIPTIGDDLPPAAMKKIQLKVDLRNFPIKRFAKAPS